VRLVQPDCAEQRRGEGMERAPNCPGWLVAMLPALLQLPVPFALQKGCSPAFYNELALSLSIRHLEPTISGLR
jgi:hypothetical protein